MVQANKRGVVSQRLAKRINVNPPSAIDGQSRALKSLNLKPSDGPEHGRVLDGGGDEVFAKPPVGQGGSLHGKVDGLCSTARENNLLHFSGVYKLGQARAEVSEAWPSQQFFHLAKQSEVTLTGLEPEEIDLRTVYLGLVGMETALPPLVGLVKREERGVIA